MMKSKSIEDYNSVAKDVMKEHLKIQKEPDIVNAYVYDQGIPQYRVSMNCNYYFKITIFY